MGNDASVFHLWVYVPLNSKERVKDALFEAGAGTIGNYSQCCWETAGTGQFLSMPGSSPAEGETGSLKKIEEYKIEMVVHSTAVKRAIEALKASHPYEEPAYGVVPLSAI